MTEQKTQPLYVQIQRILADAIEKGELKPGSKLTESSIAKHFDVSRQTVRNAMQDLAAANFVHTEPGKRGFYVSHGHKPSDKTQAESGLNAALSDAYEINRSAKWEHRYSLIKYELLALSCRGGFRIVPSNLAESHGISRTTLKDVQLRLVDDGIARVEGRSWIINRFDDAAISEQFSVRKVLEPYALRTAFPNLHRKFAMDCLERLEDVKPRAGDVESSELERLEEDLHVRTLAFCGNRFLMDLLRRCRMVHVFNSFYYPKFQPANLFVEEHIAVFEAIMNSDADGAAAALNEHLESSLNNTRARVEQFASAVKDLEFSYARQVN